MHRKQSERAKTNKVEKLHRGGHRNVSQHIWSTKIQWKYPNVLHEQGHLGIQLPWPKESTGEEK